MHEFRLQMDVPGTGPVEVVLDFGILPLRDASGQIVGVIATNADVTELLARIRFRIRPGRVKPVE